MPSAILEGLRPWDVFAVSDQAKSRAGGALVILTAMSCTAVVVVSLLHYTGTLRPAGSSDTPPTFMSTLIVIGAMVTILRGSAKLLYHVSRTLYRWRRWRYTQQLFGGRFARRPVVVHVHADTTGSNGVLDSDDELPAVEVCAAELPPGTCAEEYLQCRDCGQGGLVVRSTAASGNRTPPRRVLPATDEGVETHSGSALSYQPQSTSGPAGAGFFLTGATVAKPPGSRRPRRGSLPMGVATGRRGSSCRTDSLSGGGGASVVSSGSHRDPPLPCIPSPSPARTAPRAPGA
jgi:hypothetical protein